MEQITIKINWYGPYTIDDTEYLDGGNGLYMFTGKFKHQREDPEIQYFGITENSYKGRFKRHHKSPEINRDLNIWLGEIDYPKEHIRQHLESAESIMVYFWDPKLNEKKTLTQPKHSTTVISHWFTKDGNTRINQKGIYKNLPDVICWDGRYWRTGNLSVFEEST